MMLSVVIALFAGVSVQSAKQAPLIEAIQSKDAAKVKQLLKAGADPNARLIIVEKASAGENRPGGNTRPGATALELAARESVSLVQLLLDYKADPNGRGDYYWTPLIAACQGRDLGIVKLLLKRGAKPNLMNGHGDTAIIFSANTDQVEQVRALIKAGADLKGGTGQTPLIIAAQCGAEKTVKLLLASGADPNFRRAGYWTPLEYARTSNEEEVAAMIQKAGGMGRSKAELEKETEEWSAKFRAKIDAERKAAAEKNKEFAKLKPEDSAVIQAVLDDVGTYKDFSYGVSKGRAVYLVDTSQEFNGFSENQMSSELRESKVGLELRKDLLRRNASELDLRPLNLKEWIYVGSSEISRFQVSSNKSWVSVCLPGYSEEGNKAVVRIAFGPTAHGAAATFMLERQDGAWRVLWRKVAYYA